VLKFDGKPLMTPGKLLITPVYYLKVSDDTVRVWILTENGLRVYDVRFPSEVEVTRKLRGPDYTDCLLLVRVRGKGYRIVRRMSPNSVEVSAPDVEITPVYPNVEVSKSLRYNGVVRGALPEGVSVLRHMLPVLR